MDFIKDVQALGLLLTLQFAGFVAWLVAALPPILAILPIPHSPHEWGLTLASGGLYLLGRHRDHKQKAARVRARKVNVAPLPLAPSPPLPNRHTRRAESLPAAEEKHTTKMRKIAKP